MPLPSVDIPEVDLDELSPSGLEPLLPLVSSERVVGSDPSVITVSDVPSDVPVSVTRTLTFSAGELELMCVTENHRKVS